MKSKIDVSQIINASLQSTLKTCSICDVLYLNLKVVQTRRTPSLGIGTGTRNIKQEKPHGGSHVSLGKSDGVINCHYCIIIISNP